VAVQHRGEIRYLSAKTSEPTNWSLAITANEGARGATPTVAVDWASAKAGIAWSDARTPTSAIFFDWGEVFTWEDLGRLIVEGNVLP
jgi:hypothetical protein